MSRTSLRTFFWSIFAFVVCLFFLSSCGSTASTGNLLLRIDGDKDMHQGLGTHVEQFADLDGDSFPEILASSPHGRNGNYSIYSGSTGALVYTIGSERDKYQLKNYTVIADLNGDKVPEIAGPDTWSSRGLWVFSGKDGSAMFNVEEKMHFDHYKAPQVMTVPDKNSDGVPDLVTSHKDDIIISSGKDGKTIRRFAPPKHTDEMVRYCRAADADGDGHDDLIAFGYKKWPLRENVFQYRIRAWFLSAADFGLIGEPFDTPFDSDPDQYACADMNNDGVLDLIGCRTSGGEPSGSLLAAVSGKDGSEIWRVNGAEVEDGQKMVSVSAKTGETIKAYSDIQFGDCMALLPDINADGVPEVATGHPELYDKGRNLHGRFYIFSGGDGSIIKTVYPPNDTWRIGTSIAAYTDWNFDESPDILVGAYEHKTGERHEVGSILLLSIR